jgi:hypothetical protein
MDVFIFATNENWVGWLMKIREKNKQSEDIILDPFDSSKIECIEIPVVTPKEIEPGSKMEVRYLQYLIQKHAKDDCDTSILIKK